MPRGITYREDMGRLDIWLDHGDSLPYSWMKELDGKRMFGTRAKASGYAGSDGAICSLSVGNIGFVSWNDVDYDILYGYGKTKDEAVKNAKKLLRKLPIGHLKQNLQYLDEFLAQK
jgi:hypothetical protein